MSISCNNCGREWDRDPRLEVPCPTCKAPVGKKCKRPSEHEAPEPHIPREELAIQEGFLSRECPVKQKKQKDLFQEA